MKNRSTLLALALVLMGAGRRDRDLISQLDREVIALQQHNAMLRAQVESCDGDGVPSPVLAQLVQVFSGTEIVVERRGARAVVTLPGSLLFSPGDVRVRDEAAMALDLLATALTLHPDMHIWVEGHTDDRDPVGAVKRRYPTNWELSTARALAVTRSLVGVYGVPEDRFTVGGQAHHAPITSNDTPAGREKNRRVVVVVGPADARADDGEAK